MQNKTNKNKVVLVVGHQHNETVIVDIFNKYMPKLLEKYKVNFLDEINKETLEKSIIANKIFSLNISAFMMEYPTFSKQQSKTMRDYLTKQTKELGLKIQNPTNFEELKKALQNRDENAAIQFIDKEKAEAQDPQKYCESLYQRLLDISGADYNTEYNQMIQEYQTNQKIKYKFIDQEDLAMVSGSLISRDQSMSKNILKYIQENQEQQLFIVSVGSAHVKGMTEILSKALLSTSCKVIPVLGNEKLSSENKESYNFNSAITKTIQNVFPRIKEEQNKDEMKFVDGLYKGLMFLSSKDEVNLEDYTTKQFKCSSQTEAIEKVIALSPLKKANSIVCDYDKETMTFTITYLNVKQEKIDEIFPQQVQSFVKVVEQQKSKEVQEIARQ